VAMTRRLGTLSEREGATLEPERGVLGQEFVHQVPVSVELRFGQHAAPAPARALMEEGLRSVVERAGQNHRPFMIRFHRVELTTANNVTPKVWWHADAEEVGDASHLPVEVCKEICVVHE